MDNRTNPYTPNAGATPEAIVGRDDQINTFRDLLERLRRGRTDQSMIVTGLRGVGKTVLLGRFRELALEANWEVLDIEASKHDDSNFRQILFSKLRSALLQLSPRDRWSERFHKTAAVLSSFALSMDTGGTFALNWSVPPAEGLGDHGNLSLDLTDVLVSIGEAAKERDRGIVILIDEVQFLNRGQLEALIQAIHKVVQRRLPVTFVGAGLPQIAELAGDAKSYAERLFKFPKIGSFSATDARRALSEPAQIEGVSYTDDALDLAGEITEGYPYFVQELGSQAWSVAVGTVITKDDIKMAQEGYETKLDSSFFRVRLDRATPLQTAYMRAMAELGPEAQKAADVAKLMDRESPQIGPTRAELIDMGLLYTPEHGYAAFTVPHFDRFIKRAVPNLIVPEVQRRSQRKPRSQ